MIKFTKNELKKQKDSLARFQRYLPTLLLKKQQLQMEIRKIDVAFEALKSECDELENLLLSWAELLCDPVDLSALIQIKDVKIEQGNIAGIDIPVFKSLDIQEVEYDLFLMPLWVDKVLEEVEKLIVLHVKMNILGIQRKLIGDELLITSQRVNLFEKVKIVEAKENIRIIRIYLGDQQTAAVVRGKISKKKIERVS